MGKGTVVEEDGVNLAQLSDHELRRMIKKRLSYRSQCWALLAKSAIAQKRNYGTNTCQILTPIILMLILFLLQQWISSLVDNDSVAYRNPQNQAPFLILSKPAKGDYRPASAEILYTDAGMVGEVDIGQFDPYGGTGSGLLGAIALTNRTVSIKFPKYDDSEIYLKDLDRVPSETYNYSIVQQNSVADINRILYDATGKGALYTTAYVFDEVSVDNSVLDFGVYYNYTISYGRDIVGAMSLITQAFASLLPSPRIVANFVGIKKLPQKDDYNEFDITSLVGGLFFALILHQLLPVFLSSLAYEKENRIREMMKMMGLRMPIYWLVNYFWCYLLYCFVAAFLIIAGLVFQFRFFTVNNFGVYFILFFLWGHTLVAMSFLISVFFQRERSASTFGYFYILGITFVAVFTIQTLIYDVGEPALNGISVVPSFALVRGISWLLSEVSYNGPGLKGGDIDKGPANMSHVYAFLVVQWAVMLVLALYLDQVFPGTYGLPKHPLFFLAPLKRLPGVRHLIERCGCCHGNPEENDLEDGHEPDDVKAESSRAHSDENLPLKVQNLTKEYNVPFWESAPFSWWRYIPRLCGKAVKKRKPERALKGASFVIGSNECVGFLGPNGAGKTTTMGIICALIQPTSGQVCMYNFVLPGDVSYIHLLTGVCPQHDIIWGSLTAREHLQFYGRLKGMHGKALKKEVREVLESLNLYKVRNKPLRAFSGGMKRRLSVGMSLMGDPKLILLDEPSTGLDPKSKRALWSAISARKKQSALILTTHSMEEAEALCNRIVIMAEGRVRAVGTSAELKSRFGKGFKLTITCADHDNKAQAIAFVKQLVPGAKEISNISGTVLFYLPKRSVVLSQVFRNIDANKNSVGITDWGISNTTLEEVFHKVVSDRHVPGTEGGDDDDDDTMDHEDISHASSSSGSLRED